MVKRLTMSSHPLDGAAMDAHPHGDYVLYSDFAELEAENERLRTLVMAQSRAIHSPEALSRTGVVNVCEHDWEKTREDLCMFVCSKCRQAYTGNVISNAPDGWSGKYQSSYSALEPAASATRPCTCHPDDSPPIPCPEKYALSDCLAASPEGQQPVAWMDATGTELHKIILDYQKRNMIASGGRQAERAPNYSIALFTRPAEQAVTEAMVERALIAWFEEITWSKGMVPSMKERMMSCMSAALKAAMEAGRHE